MLQSVSFALFLFAVYRMVSYALSRSVFDVLLAIAAIIFCVISFRRSVKFRRMFYSAIYQEVLVYGNSLRDIIEREIPRRETNRQARSKPERAKSIASSTAIPTYQETDSAQPTLGRWGISGVSASVSSSYARVMITRHKGQDNTGISRPGWSRLLMM